MIDIDQLAAEAAMTIFEGCDDANADAAFTIARATDIIKAAYTLVASEGSSGNASTQFKEASASDQRAFTSEAAQLAAEAAKLWMDGESCLGRPREDEFALKDLITSAIKKGVQIELKKLLSENAKLWERVELFENEK